MPKLKSHSGAKKRFKLSKSGKVIRSHANMRHLLNGHGKTSKSKRQLRGTIVTDSTNEKAVKRMLPYA
ncbi:MAG: 50S ribosomal protein L35 [Clostridia bacterium]